MWGEGDQIKVQEGTEKRKTEKKVWGRGMKGGKSEVC